MKIIAVANRGSRKDFIDIAVLLEHFSLAEMLDFYREKTGQQVQFYVLKSLCYFDSADADAPANMLIDLPWEKVKERITDAVAEYYRHGSL